MADGDEHAFCGDIGDRAGLGMLDADPFNTQGRVGAINLVQFIEPKGFDFRVLFQTVDQDFLGA